TIYDSVGVTTGNPDVDSLVSSKGMSGMLNTVYLIICAMFFGGCMQASGMIRHIASGIIPLTRRRVPLVATTAATGVALNAVVSDQYLSIILTSNIFKGIYEKEGHDGKLLGRTIEDSSTVTSVLVPWNTCGMTQATILGIPTLTYLPFCFFNLLCPVMTVLMTAIGTGLGKGKNEDKKTDLANGNI
ncbi:MAG: sodium:proton antiporter, partial [Bacteroidales bacterium]|nr:sodium:proton antiporter [Bacteroidales bacterium]